MKFYSDEECTVALTKAVVEINKRAAFTSDYRRGFNDCFALLALYDEYLKGESRAFDKIFFEWDSTKEFQQKLYLRGYTIDTYLEYCGYHIVKNKRPQLGDVAFENGAMINDGDFWVSTDENNKGVKDKRQVFSFEPRILLARPIRS